MVGGLFLKRINLGLELLPPRRFSRALEVGYGAGGLLLTLFRGVDELHGVDMDAEPTSVERMLRARHCEATLVRGSVCDLVYPDSHFDLVVCFSVFEHLADHRRALDEIHRVLAPTGLFLLGMPSVNRTMEMLFRAIGHNTINDIHITTPRMIQDSLAPAGFKLAGYRPLDVPLPVPFGLRLYHNWLLEKRQ
jgi:ubiquinone/menaquinone biosynthesis C-methylase UbiE